MDMELVFVRRFPEALQHWRTSGMGLLSRMQALEPYPAKNGAKLSADESEYEVAKELLKTLDPNEPPKIALEPYPAKNGAKLSADESEYEVAKELLKTLDPNEPPKIGTLSKSEWEAFCMYLLFAFRKKGGPKRKNAAEQSSEQSSDNPPEKKPRTE
ncbi:hypothetical protein COOONC_08861 [Cooperia oncophora]